MAKPVKLFSFKLGVHKAYTQDKILADFMNGKSRKKKKKINWKKVFTSFVEKLLP